MSLRGAAPQKRMNKSSVSGITKKWTDQSPSLGLRGAASIYSKKSGEVGAERYNSTKAEKNQHEGWHT